MIRADQYRDACPKCGRRNNVPVVLTRTGEDAMVCRYECACGHLWRTAWSISFVEGWEAA